MAGKAFCLINEMDLIPQGLTDTGTHQPQGLRRIGPSFDPIIPSPGDGVKGEHAPESGEEILAQFGFFIKEWLD